MPACAHIPTLEPSPAPLLTSANKPPSVVFGKHLDMLLPVPSLLVSPSSESLRLACKLPSWGQECHGVGRFWGQTVPARPLFAAGGHREGWPLLPSLGFLVLNSDRGATTLQWLTVSPAHCLKDSKRWINATSLHHEGGGCHRFHPLL